MDDIERTLNDLDKKFPVTPEFRAKLGPLLKLQTGKADHVFLSAGDEARDAWKLLEGIVAVFKPDRKGRLVVVKLYLPGDIFTDLLSFFEKKPISGTYRSLTRFRARRLELDDFEGLKDFPETMRLAELIMMEEGTQESARAELLALKGPERAEAFLDMYPDINIPDAYAASFLRITEAQYRAWRNRRAAGEPRVKEELDRLRDFVMQNFRLPVVDDKASVADLFCVSPRTLDRMSFRIFDKPFGQQIIFMRMLYGLKALLLEDKNVAQAAASVGYDDARAFSKRFKKEYRITPREIAGIYVKQRK
ncbi:helix-turn-helix domain-containing protein [Pedobacter deserti]|uniref:helix-turn-helix domain-containing protein n=1 Tax=Pedobacter deserti TaxID=2817382 RepID=UPI00210C154F|nr:helix-turn-helix domain-containing protein [Pedobacter sp. SYSU D00382]